MKFQFKDIETKRMKLDELKPAEYNPRTISNRALNGLGKSMERFGNLVPIVWNKRSGHIVGGHQRYRLLVESGEKETDVVVVDLDDNEEMALNIALNSRELRGDFTPEVVKQLELCEVRMGDAFSDMGLMDLLKEMQKLKPKEKKPLSTIGRDDKPRSTSHHEDDAGDNVQPEGPDAIITCPKCQSRWKMKNNEVVFDAVKAKGAKDD